MFWKDLFGFCCILLIVMLKISTVLGIDDVSQLRKEQEMDYYKAMLDFYALQSDAIVSEQCKIDCELYKKAFLNKELWALKMYDSSTKMQSGILSGNLADFGDFNQCINIKVVVENNITIRGKHVLTTMRGYVYLSPYPFQRQLGIPMLQMPYLNFLNQTMSEIKVYQVPAGKRQQRQPLVDHRWAICVPDSCNLKEIVEHLKLYMNRDNVTNVILRQTYEQTLESQFQIRPMDWIVIAVFVFVAVLMLMSTIYDTYLHYSQTKTEHWILTMFSVLSNGRRLVTISTNPELLPCLDGIRVICMLWIMLGHDQESFMFGYNYNTIETFETLTKFWYQFIFSNQIHVKQFFMMGGFLIMYNFLRSREREPTFNIIKFYIRRYLRLTPSLIAAILVHLSILRLLASGPAFQIVFNYTKSCKENWWHALLYVSNYVDPYAICVPQTWYLSADTQLYWISPLLLLPVVWYKKFCYYLFGIILVIGIAVPWYIVYDNQLISNGSPNDYLTLYHLATQSYITPWIIGHTLAYYIYHNKGKKFKIPLWLATSLWILTIALCAYSALGLYPITQPDYVYNRAYNSWYVAFSPLFWCSGVSWIIFACIFGYGGIVNWFLALPMWQPLSKLTYSMFLTHYGIQTTMHSAIKIPTWFSPINVFYSFCGLTGSTLFVSLIWTMAFEMPFMVIDAYLFKKVKPKNQMTIPAMIIPKEETRITTNRMDVTQ